MTDTIAALAKTDLERIVRHDVLANAFNKEFVLAKHKFFVDLECGHKALTGALNKARCLRCTEMLRRSIADGSEDYESFRKGLTRDNMIWLDDPCRTFNEPTDPEGNFVNDYGCERKPFDIKTDVTLECPQCGQYKTVPRPQNLPANVRLIEVICPVCDDGDRHAETWFSAPGVEVSQDREG